MKDSGRTGKLLGCILSLFLIVAGCSGSEDDGAGPSSLTGYVTAGDAVADADVRVTDKNGNVLAQKTSATSEAGAFVLTLENLPSQFRIYAEGGSRSGEDVDYTLMGQFTGSEAARGAIHLNMVTTLVCAYLDRHPEKSLAEARTAVKGFLGLPAEADIGEGIYHDQVDFSHFEFFQAAAANGGVSHFIAMLMAEMDSDTAAVHTFRGVLLGGPEADGCPGATMTQALRNGAIAWGAGFALNIAASQLGIDEYFGIAGPTKADVDSMISALKNISTQLYNLSVNVESSKNEIIEEIRKASVSSAVRDMQAYETLIRNTYRDLKTELDKDPAKLTEEEKDARTRTINDRLETVRNHIAPYQGTIHSIVYGNAYSQGAYLLYANSIKRKFLSKDYYKKVNDMFQYYNMLEALETYLSIEFYRKDKQSKETVKTHTDQLDADSQLELVWIKRVIQIPDGIYLYPDRLTMIYLPGNYYENMECGARWCSGNPVFTGGMTAVFYNSLYYMIGMNTNKFMGFENWSYPTPDEMIDFFAGWKTSPWEYAKAQGLTAMEKDRYLTCSARSVAEWRTRCLLGACGEGYNYNYYQTNDGAMGTKPFSWAETDKVQLVPVRRMTTSELGQYVWQ